MERMDSSREDDFNEKSKSFLSWLKQNGASISAKIKLADLRQQNAGRGVVAVEDLKEDEELFSIPRSLILTTETSSIDPAVFKEVDDPWLSLILVMALEYLSGADSRWKPYSDVLPEAFDTLMFWSDSELSHLAGSTVVNKIGKDSADTVFSEQLIPLIGRSVTKSSLNNDELLELCHRMGSTIMAYAFDLEKASDQQETEEEWEEDSDAGAILPKGMVPLADMLNADADRNNAKLFYEDDKVVMKTITAVRAGEELYNDFGSLPRADLLRRYGYVTENYAKYDVVEIPVDLIKDKAKLASEELEERWVYAEEQGVLDDGYDINRAHNDVEQLFSEELGVLLNLLVSPLAEFEKMKKKDKLPKPDLTTEAKSLLRTVLVYRYAEYPAQNEAATSDDISLNEHRLRMAKQVIEGEKQVLREAIDIMTENISGKKRSADTLEEEVAAIRHASKR